MRVDSACLISEFLHGTQLGRCWSIRKNGIGNQLFYNSTAFAITPEEPAAILADPPLIKRYKTYAYFDRTARQNASKISATERIRLISVF